MVNSSILILVAQRGFSYGQDCFGLGCHTLGHCTAPFVLRTEAENRSKGRGNSGRCWEDNAVLSKASTLWWSSDFPAFCDVQFLSEKPLHLADLEELSSCELVHLGFQPMWTLNLYNIFLRAVPQANHVLCMP